MGEKATWHNAKYPFIKCRTIYLQDHTLLNNPYITFPNYLVYSKTVS